MGKQVVEPLIDRQEITAFMASARGDFQQTRIECSNRLRNLIRRKLEGIEGVEEKREEGEEKEYGAWGDDVIEEKLQEALAEKKLTQEDFEYIVSIREMVEKFNKEEKAYEAGFAKEVATYPIWTEWLKDVKGIGPTTTIILSSILGDCSRFATRSKLWAYAGYHTKEGHAVVRKVGVKSNWNSNLKKRMFNVATQLVMAGGKYAKEYRVFKAELQAKHPVPVASGEKTKDGKPKMLYTKLHIERMARRKLIKLFLSHWWEMSRKLAGLPTESLWVLEHEPDVQHTYISPESMMEKKGDTKSAIVRVDLPKVIGKKKKSK